MQETIQVGSAKATPGQKGRGSLFVCDYPDATSCSLPVMIVNGKYDGPVLWLNAALHGNELNGVVGTMELFQKISAEELHGAVICTPICNPLAFSINKGYPGTMVSILGKVILEMSMGR